MNKFPTPSLPCLCASFRRTARALTQVYENAFRPLGLKASQFTILQALSYCGEVSQGQLGTMLAMDTTTLTRTLEIMNKHGWLAERRGEDRRERWLRLAKAGEIQLSRALPVWERVQAQLRERVGERRWKQLFQFTHQLATEAITQNQNRDLETKV